MTQKIKSLSYVEISKSALLENFRIFKEYISPKVKISLVVKANAYGHGLREVVEILDKKADYFQVNSCLELTEIRKYTKRPVLVLGYVSENEIPGAIKQNAILAVFDIENARNIDRSAKKLGAIVDVHVAVDSHLGREGVLPNDLPEFLTKVKLLKNISIKGMYSHFANIEDTADLSHSEKQASAYEKSFEIFKKFGYGNIERHISATSGILVHDKNENKNNIVRLGIGLYGMWPASHLQKNMKGKNLSPIIRLVTHVAQVKNLPKGHSIGYGLTYITTKNTKVAVIPLGYSDGLDRRMSSNGEVLIGGKKCNILGRVAMNMFVADVSKISGVKAGDEAVILGKQGKSQISAEDIAHKIGTINYEITTKISPLLPRVIKS